MGYTRVRHYDGGMADWRQGGEPVEGTDTLLGRALGRAGAGEGAGGEGAASGHGAAPPMGSSSLPASSRAAVSRRSGWSGRLMDAVERRTVGELLLTWFGLTVVFGLVYWGAGFVPGQGLIWQASGNRGPGVGLADALYFSFVTVLSIGYGDLVPSGAVRVLALVQGAAGLLLFGAIVSRLVSRRQDALLEEIHRNSFEDQLERVRIGLHLVLSEMQALSERCREPGERPERVMSRVESAAAVFEGELRTIHSVLYRPHLSPEEGALESILASLSAGLSEFADLLGCLPRGAPRSASFDATLRSMSLLANEICGECVPREYAPRLRDWMDRIQAMASRLHQGHHGA